MRRLIQTILAAAILALGIAGGAGLGQAGTARPDGTIAVTAEGGMGPDVAPR
ncbi:hypothetical protein [Actinoplanes sp. NPDC051411]|uniref:hypothetical protein n=1 Tax=Actinoplanes sp. NPDC051411 TaxID=3155522 RepID=UPI003422B2B7